MDHIKRSSYLQNADFETLDGNSDPFVEIFLNDTLHAKTHIFQNSESPIWDEVHLVIGERQGRLQQRRYPRRSASAAGEQHAAVARLLMSG